MKAVILAAGKSTRTYPLTLTRPKPLLPIANTPILAHQLNALAALVDEAILVVGYRKEMITARFGARYRNLKLTYVEQHEQLGTGDAVLRAADRIEEPFLAMNGDDLFDPADLRKLTAVAQGALAKHVPDPRLYGVYEIDERGHAVRLVEKPTEVFSTLANIGAYKLDPSVFDVLRKTPKSERGELELTSAIQEIAQHAAFHVVASEGYWLPIGYPWHLLNANEYLLTHQFDARIAGEVSSLATLEGPVAIGKGTVVKPGVVIEGPAIIGETCVIGPNCYIRPGTAIGNGCKVGQAVEIKNSILMDRSAAPHLCYVGDSIIGEGVNLGAGTIIANYRHDGQTHRSMVKGELIDTGRRKFGAVLGDGAHTGIHTTIYPGRKLWPHTSTRPGACVQQDVTG
jgi:UDP-N-acetylglucosamine diphosphorylase / glucose-1-phosphate thymidylyltransferase / UDP-N-acetylgalactosamine diphosphorylase / glucosamine-1-phosphate N-acetyltransferase / galactosamine-1-phosphate N-acetyltransferase